LRRLAITRSHAVYLARLAIDFSLFDTLFRVVSTPVGPSAHGRLQRKLFQAKLKWAQDAAAAVTGSKMQLFQQLMFELNVNPSVEAEMTAALLGKGKNGPVAQSVAAAYTQAVDEETTANAIVERLSRCVEDMTRMLTLHAKGIFNSRLDMDRVHELGSKVGKPSNHGCMQDMEDSKELFSVYRARCNLKCDGLLYSTDLSTSIVTTDNII